MLKYYIVPQEHFSLAQTASDLSYSNYIPRISLDGLFGLYKIEDSNLPIELSALTAYNINNDSDLFFELDSLTWTDSPGEGGEI